MILLIDNYDSFTFNLEQALSKLGAEVTVVRNDAVSLATLRASPPRALVLSPGPGHPLDAGLTPEIIHALASRCPILGVCLGHQAIGAVMGGHVIRVAPVHGRASLAHHRGGGLFAELPSPLVVGRYHSLALDPHRLPPSLAVTAWTNDGVIMGLQHRTLPLFGVQFHPESILTPEGESLLANFLTRVTR